MALLTTISVLANIVPAIAGWLGGDKAEEAATKVAEVARTITGQSDLGKAVGQIQNDPAAQKDFILAMEGKRQSFDEMYLKDRQHARNTQADIAKNGKSRLAREFIYWYAGILSLLSCVYIGCITFLPIPTENQRFADTILGFVLGTILAAIVQFFFGASKPVREDE